MEEKESIVIKLPGPEGEIKTQILNDIRTEAEKRHLPFRAQQRGRSYEFFVGDACGVIKISGLRSREYEEWIWVGIMQSTWDEFEGKKAFAVIKDLAQNKLIVLPFQFITDADAWSLSTRGQYPFYTFALKKIGDEYVLRGTQRSLAQFVDNIELIFEVA